MLDLTESVIETLPSSAPTIPQSFGDITQHYSRVICGQKARVFKRGHAEAVPTSERPRKMCARVFVCIDLDLLLEEMSKQFWSIH